MGVCKGCKYFDVCGDSKRTHKCDGYIAGNIKKPGKKFVPAVETSKKSKKITPCENCDAPTYACKTCLCKACARFRGCKGSTRCRGPY
jgi:hypothetical protein